MFRSYVRHPSPQRQPLDEGYRRETGKSTPPETRCSHTREQSVDSGCRDHGVRGGHLNPAATVTLWRPGTFPGRAVVPYIAAQAAGTQDKRGKIPAKGGATEWIHRQSDTAQLLPRLIARRTRGPLFLTGRKAPAERRSPTCTRRPAGPGSPTAGRRRSSRRTPACRPITHDAENGTSTPLPTRFRHTSVRPLDRYARPDRRGCPAHSRTRPPPAGEVEPPEPTSGPRLEHVQTPCQGTAWVLDSSGRARGLRNPLGVECAALPSYCADLARYGPCPHGLRQVHRHAAARG